MSTEVSMEFCVPGYDPWALGMEYNRGLSRKFGGQCCTKALDGAWTLLIWRMWALDSAGSTSGRSLGIGLAVSIDLCEIKRGLRCCGLQITQSRLNQFNSSTFHNFRSPWFCLISCSCWFFGVHLRPRQTNRLKRSIRCRTRAKIKAMKQTCFTQQISTGTSWTSHTWLSGAAAVWFQDSSNGKRRCCIRYHQDRSKSFLRSPFPRLYRNESFQELDVSFLYLFIALYQIRVRPISVITLWFLLHRLHCAVNANCVLCAGLHSSRTNLDNVLYSYCSIILNQQTFQHLTHPDPMNWTFTLW